MERSIHLLQAVFALNCIGFAFAQREQFLGGSIAYSVEWLSNNETVVTLELITGWVYGKGPCGPNCTTLDIGKLTNPMRQAVMQNRSDPSWFGTYKAEYKFKNNNSFIQENLTSAVQLNYTGHVLALSRTGGWEQEILTSSFRSPFHEGDFVIRYEGHSWRQLHLQLEPRLNSRDFYWHFQMKIKTSLRSDTNQTNKCPRCLLKPVYRVNLEAVTSIALATIDDEGDVIRCDMEAFVENLKVPPNVTVNKNCTIDINATEVNGYGNDTWIIVPVKMSDYNRKKITYDNDEVLPGSFALCSTIAQILVQVLDTVSTVEFVKPTLEGNHRFVLYSGATWRTDVYLKSTSRGSVAEVRAYGIRNETIHVSTLQDKVINNEQLTWATLTWVPQKNDAGSHLACATVYDGAGLDSAEMRCFLLYTEAKTFNYTSNVTQDRPYFADIPSPTEVVRCDEGTTCIIPLHVTGPNKVSDVQIVSSEVQDRHLGPLEETTHQGVQVAKADFFFSHPSHDKMKSCFMATDINGNSSDVICIFSKTLPPDPCLSAPCWNGGTCQGDDDTGGFRCHCFAKTTGRLCEIKIDPCSPDPCVYPNSYVCANLPNQLCYCKPGWTGHLCETSIQDCNETACGGHGTCVDKHMGYDCKCFNRYNGTECEIDACPMADKNVLSCPPPSCLPDPCNGRGVCSGGPVCTCPMGYSGIHCETAKCSMSDTNSAIKIISPTQADKSQWTCYDVIEQCILRVYMTPNSSEIPTIEIDVSTPLKAITSATPATRSTDIPGIKDVLASDILLNGFMNSTGEQYVCVIAKVGTSKSSRCFEMVFKSTHKKNALPPGSNTGQTFVSPTLTDGSGIQCAAEETCTLLLYTAYLSKRTACTVVTIPVPVKVSGGCDESDHDNDANDTSQASDPCCLNIASTNPEVTVYPAHPRGQACVSEAAFRFSQPGEKTIFFSSMGSSSQQIHYSVNVFDPKNDTCANSPCQNNGKCFRTRNNNFKCICPENYVGDSCERGPCQAFADKCQNEAYCQTNNRVNTCICRAGYTGEDCQKGSADQHLTETTFLDTAKLSVLTCVRYVTCSAALMLSGGGVTPTINAGYVSHALKVMGTEVHRVRESYQASVLLKGTELGLQDCCLQVTDVKGVVTDETCFKVYVTSDVLSIYSFKDTPNFIDPSLPTDSLVQCPADSGCHVVYNVNPGTGNENECIMFTPTFPKNFYNFHVYTSCDKCIPGVSSTGNCSVDISVVNHREDIGKTRHACLSLGLQGKSVTGERRCFNMTVTEATDRKTGCALTQCQNRAFCDGQIQEKPVCYCQIGYSGPQCEKEDSGQTLPASRTQTFFNDFGIPSVIYCVIPRHCSVPFQMSTKPGVSPIVKLGYASSDLAVEQPVWHVRDDSSTLYAGYVKVSTSKAGAYIICVQALTKRRTEDLMCAKINVTEMQAETVDQNQPYFIPPSIPGGSTVLCQKDTTCHVEMHFTNGDAFGADKVCPKITETDPVEGLHIFDAVQQSDHCSSDIAYHASNLGQNQLCVQVSLPGKRGEIRCVTLSVVNDLISEDLCHLEIQEARKKGMKLMTFGNSTCFCKPVGESTAVPQTTLVKVAGYGAGGMAGTVGAGAAIYTVVKKFGLPSKTRKTSVVPKDEETK